MCIYFGLGFNIVTVMELSAEDLALHSNNLVSHIHFKMEDESISIISFDDRSYNEKAIENMKQTNHVHNANVKSFAYLK